MVTEKNTDIWFIIQRKSIPNTGIDFAYNIKKIQIIDAIFSQVESEMAL